MSRKATAFGAMSEKSLSFWWGGKIFHPRVASNPYKKNRLLFRRSAPHLRRTCGPVDNHERLPRATMRG
jgi:hypothetical protein